MHFNGGQAIIKVVQAVSQNQEIRKQSTKGRRQERGQREHRNWVSTGRSNSTYNTETKQGNNGRRRGTYNK